MIFIILLIVLTIPLCFGLLGNHLVNGHDALSGLIRILCMDQYFFSGQLFPRWSADLNHGYGCPMFNFYPPLVYLLSVIFSKVTHNALIALNLVCILFWMLSGIGMYLFAKEIWGKKGGFLSAIVYLYAPYHIQDLYVRGAFAEFSALAFFPFILLAFYKLSVKVERNYILLGVLSIFALSLAHNIMSLLFFPIAFMYLISLSLRTKNLRYFILGSGTVAVGLMMSAFFWLPALLEKKFLNLSFLIAMRYDFHKNFATLGQLFSTPWGGGEMQGLSFQIGWILVLLSLLPLIWIFRKAHSNQAFHYAFFIVIGLLAIFTALPYSVFLWEKISLLKFVQFPWRILGIIIFALAFVCGAVVTFWKKESTTNLVLGVAVILSVLLSIPFLRSIETKAVDLKLLKENIENTVYLGEGEYTPAWIKTPLLSKPPQKFEVIQGKGQFAEHKLINPIKHEIKMIAEMPSLVCFHSFYFPGWKAFVDGREVQIYPDNPYGVIIFPVPAGEHVLQVAFGTTTIRMFAVILSLIGWGLLLIGMMFYENFNRYTR